MIDGKTRNIAIGAALGLTLLIAVVIYAIKANNRKKLKALEDDGDEQQGQGAGRASLLSDEMKLIVVEQKVLTQVCKNQQEDIDALKANFNTIAQKLYPEKQLKFEKSAALVKSGNAEDYLQQYNEAKAGGREALTAFYNRPDIPRQLKSAAGKQIRKYQ
jgi:hypothetical protein